MTPEDLIKETGDAIEFNTKKVQILDKDIEQIKQESQQKINKLNQDRNQIIAQIIIERCEHPEWFIVEDLDETNRGDGGFGSTGK